MGRVIVGRVIVGRVNGNPFQPVRQKIRCRVRVYPHDIIVHNGGLEQY